MSNSHGQVSRLGINVQFGKSLPGFPGWGSNFMRGRIGNAAGFASQGMHSAGNPPANWLGRSRAGNLVTNREFEHFLTRYPRRNMEVWRYAVDLTVGGQANYISFSVWAATLYRASHLGIDKGATSGTVKIEYADIYFTDGTSTRAWAGAVLFSAINGWNARGQVWKWQSALNYGKPVQYVKFSVIIEFGDESYHDTGDGVPRTGDWTPDGVIGDGNQGVGFNYGEIRDSNTEGIIDRERTYIVQSNPGYPQLLPVNSSVARSAIVEKIGTQGGGGYRSATAYNLW